MALDPGHREAGFNLALLLLLRGDFAQGWDEYEQRWRLLEVTKPNLAQPEWDGDDLGGRTILLFAEQGFGDTIQCLRYVPSVAARAGRVILYVERPLVRLAASLAGNVVISAEGRTSAAVRRLVPDAEPAAPLPNGGRDDSARTLFAAAARGRRTVATSPRRTARHEDRTGLGRQPAPCQRLPAVD